MIEHSEEQTFRVEGHLYQSNPFKEYPKVQIQDQQQKDPDHPLCLNTKQIQSQNTPLSRLSQQTYQSQIKQSITIKSQKQTAYKYISERSSQYLKLQPIQTNQELKAQIRNLTQSLADLTCFVKVLQKRNQEIAIALEKQKLKSTHLEHALSILRRGDQHLDRKIAEQAQMCVKIKQQYDEQKDRCMMLSQKLQNSQAQNTYLKQLILIANSNYEILQKKYSSIVQRNKKIQEQNLSKQKQLTYNMHQMKNLLTDLINTPNGQNILTHNLSFGEQDQNLKKVPVCPNNKVQKKPVQQIYRKMFIKTLKGKK